MKRFIYAFIMVSLIPLSLRSQGKISGYSYFDFFYVPQHHNDSIRDMNGFWFRRIYFTYDHEISEKFSARLRFELNSPGDYVRREDLRPYIKDAYLKWKLNSFEFLLGLTPTPTWEVIEDHYGYRSVEKTPVDLQRIGTSRDIGFSLKGGFGEDKKLKFHFTFGNGEGIRSENNKQKALYLSISYHLPIFLFEIYGDWFDALGHKQTYTVQGFAGLKNKKFRLGLQYVNQTQLRDPDKTQSFRIASSYLVFSPTEFFDVLLRYDKNFDKNSRGRTISYTPFSPAFSSNFVLVAFAVKPHKNVSIIPNVKGVFYDKENDVQPRSDIYLSLTFYYNFK
ncbi:MAG: hypothetical protein ABDH49_03185 [Candidatus Hydrothermales bacterium]